MDSALEIQGAALQPEYLPICPRHSDEGGGRHRTETVGVFALESELKVQLKTMMISQYINLYQLRCPWVIWCSMGYPMGFDVFCQPSQEPISGRAHAAAGARGGRSPTHGGEEKASTKSGPRFFWLESDLKNNQFV